MSTNLILPFVDFFFFLIPLLFFLLELILLRGDHLSFSSGISFSSAEFGLNMYKTGGEREGEDIGIIYE